MKILSIGNSFSQDAHKWLSPIAASSGECITAVNLYIGGCSLETHWNNYVSNACEYDMEVNGVFIQKVSIAEALRSDDWDVVTFQQASPYSGIFESYEPFLSDLSHAVREISPRSKFYIHQTWAYETDCTYSEAYEKYHFSQQEMYEKLTEAYEKAAAILDCEIIPAGAVIQRLRQTVSEFDYGNGGLSLNCDGLHLSALYGRYAAALTWYGKLFGKDVSRVCFIPEESGEKADTQLLRKINRCVQSVLNEYK